jgi:phospholipid/cholesterol/gamma-HCH transport system substrate-binding protein
VGQRYVELDETPGAATKLRGGQTIPLAQTSPALNLNNLFNGFRPLFQALNPADVNALSYEIIKTLQGEGGTIDALLANTASLTNTIADRDAVIGAVVNNLDGVLRTVDANDQGLDEFIVQIQRLVTGLAADRSTIAASLGNISNLALSSAQLIASIRPSLPGDLMGLDGLAAALATTTNPNGQNTLDAVLHTLPPKLNTIIRTATYGSWFNFYLCDADMATVGPNSTLVRTGPRIHAMAAACGPGD